MSIGLLEDVDPTKASLHQTKYSESETVFKVTELSLTKLFNVF